MFGRDWEPALATIVMARVKGVGGKTGMKSIFEFVADVRPPGGGEVFRTELHDPRESGFRPPGEGMEVRVLADAKHGKAKFDMTDPARSRPKPSHKKQESWKAGADAAPGTAVGAGPAETPPTDAEMMAIWQAKNAHSSRVEEIRARDDLSQLEAWTETDRDLSMDLLRANSLRPDWKAPI